MILTNNNLNLIIYIFIIEENFNDSDIRLREINFLALKSKKNKFDKEHNINKMPDDDIISHSENLFQEFASMNINRQDLNLAEETSKTTKSKSIRASRVSIISYSISNRFLLLFMYQIKNATGENFKSKKFILI